MEKTLSLFKKFLPIIIVVSFVATVFGLFTLMYYYDKSTISIQFKNIIPIITAVFLVAAYGVAICFSLKVKTLHIKRIKKDSNFSKFATALAAVLVTALFLFNFIQLVQNSSLPVFKVLRLIVSIPFIAYLVLGLIPRKINRKVVKIPTWLTYIASVCAILWCIFSLLALYFWSGPQALPTTNVFRLFHLFYYAVAIVFFISEVGFEIFSKGHKLYVLASSCLFITSCVITGSIMFAIFLGKIPEVSLSAIEIFASFSIGIYALSKMFAVGKTISHVMKQEDSSRSHHHHHHHKSSKAKVTESGSTKSAIPNDIDI